MELSLTLPGRPITKKNHSRIVVNRTTGRPMVIPSAEYKEYEERCGWYINCKGRKVNTPVNLKCVYYMPTRHKVDLANLLSATCDILVRYGVLEDDNSRIVVSHDGSEVRQDKDNPRVEITITDKEI